MRFSAALALCAAPLALAGSLQADLARRGSVGVEVQQSGSSKDTTQITEIIVIWVNNGGNSQTSTVNSAASVSAGSAAAATHQVTVGGDAGLVYSPNTLEANVGDMVIFTFMSANHTVTQAAFTTPCEALAGGTDSGFMPNANNTVVPAPQMAMQVKVSTPLWFYCRQKGHCGKGMTFSINPTANKTQAEFQQMAIAQNGTGTTAVIAGGQATATAASVAVSAPPASVAAAAPSVVASSGTATMASGTGNLNSNGACSCSCLCGVAAFPNAAVQGIGSYGGMSGAMPMSALES
ncbi:hypothetical protein G7Y89_g14991 [Cudoniella acicularis]|uniref:Phytocyanin domain-containing protein n=1 Tax=Cudoniella acicularis TaxID=354080 RepID=A0A8H4VQ13_9HELO|nr:hypothetical protein G7Y89_g14991 [Cudoniella acicularis]